MLKRQIGLVAIVTLLLLPNLVSAAEIPENTNLSSSNVRVQISDRGGVIIQTPNINIDTTKPVIERVIISRKYRRYRTPIVKRGRIVSPTIVRQQAIDRVTPTVEHVDSIRNSTIRTSTNDSHTISEQHVQCHGSGSSIVQSSQTINGRTVSSEVQTNCN
jgi:hypothetical protein